MKLVNLTGDVEVVAGVMLLSNGNQIDFTKEPWVGHSLLEVADLFTDRGVVATQVVEPVEVVAIINTASSSVELSILLEQAEEVNEALAFQRDPGEFLGPYGYIS